MNAPVKLDGVLPQILVESTTIPADSNRMPPTSVPQPVCEFPEIRHPRIVAGAVKNKPPPVALQQGALHPAEAKASTTFDVMMQFSSSSGPFPTLYTPPPMAMTPALQPLADPWRRLPEIVVPMIVTAAFSIYIPAPYPLEVA